MYHAHLGVFAFYAKLPTQAEVILEVTFCLIKLSVSRVVAIDPTGQCMSDLAAEREK